MGLYIVANSDGHVISSTDGINWSEAFDAGISIGKVAIGPDKIVYTRCDVEEDMNTAPGLYYTSYWNQTPVLAEGTNQYYYSEVHYLGGKFVAVGFEDTSPRVPAYAYSEDGVNWTIGQVDPGYAEIVGGGNDMQFSDVGYNEVGYFIISKVSGEGLAGGFYTSDLSQLDETNWVNIENFPADGNQLVYAGYPEGGENFGAWSVFSDDRKTWFATFNTDPSQPWNFINPGWDLSTVLNNQTGLSDLSIQEATIGMLDGFVVWMLSTENGQIIWWPHIPAGPFVSVPNPYTTNVSTVDNLNPLEVTIDSSHLPIDNEKITITGSTGLVGFDGTYFVESIGGNSYRLYSDSGQSNEIDASGWTGTYDPGSATVILSRGTFIDALGYGDGKFFAGNDDEEVFVCSSLNEGYLIWTKVDDQNNSFEYWNDVDYGDMNSCNNQTYELDLTPDNPELIPNYAYDGEGNMDTSTVVIDGNRVSIQRTGYFELVDACGNRKVISVKDGETYTNTPST